VRFALSEFSNVSNSLLKNLLIFQLHADLKLLVLFIFDCDLLKYAQETDNLRIKITMDNDEGTLAAPQQRVILTPH
jgi:hypothetical protein